MMLAVRSIDTGNPQGRIVNLESSAGRKRLNDQRLKVADIILTTTRGFVSKSIRTVTRSDISHAMVYVEQCSVIDATDEGVHSRNTQRLFLDSECPVHALRLREAMSDVQVHTVCAFVRGQIGTRYSSGEAIRTALGGALRSSREQFCSRLVAQAFASAGILLVENSDYCSPEEIKASPLLVEVADVTVPVASNEAETLEGLADVPQIMRDAINYVLEGARSKNRDIQNFDDIHRHLFEHPEDDRFMCRVLKKSGYLSVWQIEMEKSQWQYDLDLMRTAGGAGIDEYCWAVLENEKLGPNRYAVNREGYVLFARRSGLHFFRLLAELYEELLVLHRTRVDTARKWLECNGHIVATPNSVLRPHTPEWFAALEIWDPPTAAMSRIAVESVGSLDVCSVCGDEPASDFRLVLRQRPANGPDTLRLCDDCLKIRSQNGESFVRLPDEA